MRQIRIKRNAMLEIRSRVLGRAFRNLPVPAFIVDGHRTVVAMNREASAAVGLPAEAVVGKMTCREVCACRVPLVDCPFKQALREPAAGYRVRVDMAPNGRRRTVLERLHAFHDPERDETMAALVWIRDRRWRSSRKSAGGG